MPGILSTFLPTPLHPAVVHLPMALAVLLPVFAVGGLIAVQRGAPALRAWGIVLSLFAAVSLSAWVSMETGEDEEEKVERVVPETALETHEEAAEQFLWLSLGVLTVAAAGVLNGRAGSAARLIATVGSLATLAMGYRVGHSGGALVYTHGAARAYAPQPSSGSVLPARASDEHDQ